MVKKPTLIQKSASVVKVVWSFVRMYLSLTKVKIKPGSNFLRVVTKNALKKRWPHALLSAFIGKIDPEIP